MATALAETITKNFLNCSICFENFRDPRALPCQHGFCRECLEQCTDSSEDKETLICPICRREVKLTKECVAELPVYFLVSSLQDTLNMETPAHNSPDIACSNCTTPGSIATVRCLDCSEYLCENCFASHQTFKALKDHRVIPMADIKSGKVNLVNEEKNRFCTVHGKLYEYYCEVEERPLCKDCVILNECPSEHSRISLKKASQIHIDKLKDLLHESTETLKKYTDEVLANSQAKRELELWSKTQNEMAESAETDCINQVKQIFRQLKNNIVHAKKKGMEELDQLDADLKSSITFIKNSIKKTENLIQTKSEFEIVSEQSTLSSQLQELYLEQRKGTDQNMADLDSVFQRIKEQLGILLKEIIKQQKWQLISDFNTGDFGDLQGLALQNDDNIVLCSWNKGAKTFSRNGDRQCTLCNSSGAIDVAVSSENIYLSLRLDDSLLNIYGRDCVLIKSIPITNVHNQASNAHSVAVDSNNRIIVGQVKKTISIHNTDGSVIYKFATQFAPYRLAATSDGKIVCSFFDENLKRGTSVKIMDYLGGNLRTLPSPDKVKIWSPRFVCCGHGEIFVATSSQGNPKGVYRYNSIGDYLGCVTTEVSEPSGIALSEDETELLVAEYDGCVKIFQRP